MVNEAHIFLLDSSSRQSSSQSSRKSCPSSVSETILLEENSELESKAVVTHSGLFKLFHGYRALQINQLNSHVITVVYCVIVMVYDEFFSVFPFSMNFGKSFFSDFLKFLKHLFYFSWLYTYVLRFSTLEVSIKN